MAFSAKLQGVLKSIQSTQGKDIIINLIDKPKDYPLLCSTQSLGLDEALGGGWAKGRIIEVSGPESSGKTTLSLHAIINVQKQGKVAAFIDVEQAFDHMYFEALGGNLTDLIFIQPDSGEQALNSMEMLAESGEVALIVLDSTNALVPQAELDGASGDLKVGLMARLLGQHLRKVNISVKNGVTLFYISQIREKIGIMFGDPRVIGVGNAMKFYASQRVMFSKMETLKIGEEAVGNKTKAKVTKNKVAPPFKEAIFTIVFGQGVSQDSEIVAACLAKGILIKDTQGVKVNFDTPIWSKESAIESTETKTTDILKEPIFTELYYEINQRLNLDLGKITQEEFDAVMNPIYETFKVQNEQFEALNELITLASNKSNHVLAINYLIDALCIRPLDKKAQKRFKDMEDRLEKRVIKGEVINWKVELTDDTSTGPYDLDVKEKYTHFKAQLS